MRIAFLADPNIANGWYRGFGPMSVLASRGHVVRALPTDAKRPPLAALRDVDVLHIHRYADPRAEALVREAKAHGVAVVWDDDDDMGSIPKDTTAYRHYGGFGWEKRFASLRRMFRHVDLVTAPSAHLAQRLLEYGAPRTEVIENYIPGLFLNHVTPPGNGGVTIGWVAALEHQIEAERLPIVAVLQRLLDERADLQVVSIGLGLGLQSHRYHRTKKVQLIEYEQEYAVADAPGDAPKGVVSANRARTDVKIKKVAPGGLANHTATFDIALAPLADIPLNRSRSNVKLKEYAAGGAPWLASPVGPYVGMGEKQGGRLVADDRWYEELSRLLDKPRERGKLAKRAAKWAAQETLEQNVHRWEESLGRALARA